MGLGLRPGDLSLTGLVSEHGYAGQGHWLMFLFEVRPRLACLPPPHREGRFEFFACEAMAALALPQTDRERIWPWFWQHRGGFFAAHCHCGPDGRNEWTLEEERLRLLDEIIGILTSSIETLRNAPQTPPAKTTYLREDGLVYGIDDPLPSALDPRPSTLGTPPPEPWTI